MLEFNKELTPAQLALTYPALLKRKGGYRTGFIGKYGVGKPPGPDVFDYNKGFAGQGKFIMEKNGKVFHLTDVMANQAAEFLEGCSREQPFHLSISFKAPHVQDSASVKSDQFPYDPRPEIADLYKDVTIPLPKTATEDYFQRWPGFLKNSENRSRWAVRYWGADRTQESLKGYYRLVSGVDRAVGRILANLEVLGFADNTVVIFTSDHGQFLGEYGFAGKWYPHEPSIRIPLIVHDPRAPSGRRGTRTSSFALSIDLAPTMLQLAGVEIPEGMQGRSLVPLLNGASVPDWRHEFYYEHFFQPMDGWSMFIPRNEGIRTTRWKYIRYVDSSPLFEELYDLEQDYEETENLALLPKYSEVLKDFRNRIGDLRNAVR